MGVCSNIFQWVLWTHVHRISESVGFYLNSDGTLRRLQRRDMPVSHLRVRFNWSFSQICHSLSPSYLFISIAAIFISHFSYLSKVHDFFIFKVIFISLNCSLVLFHSVLWSSSNSMSSQTLWYHKPHLIPSENFGQLVSIGMLKPLCFKLIFLCFLGRFSLRWQLNFLVWICEPGNHIGAIDSNRYKASEHIQKRIEVSPWTERTLAPRYPKICQSSMFQRAPSDIHGLVRA